MGDEQSQAGQCFCEKFENQENKAPEPVKDLICVNIANVGEGRNQFRMEAKKGWKWSKDMKPLIKTDWCKKTHFGVVVKGSMKVWMKDDEGKDIGEPKIFEQGNMYYVGPNHDQEIVEDLQGFEFSEQHVQK